MPRIHVHFHDAFEEGQHPRGEGGKFSSTNSSGVRVNTTHYSHGPISTVERGNAYKAVIHPKHHETIRQAHQGKAGELTDEQGLRWRVHPAEHGVTLHGTSTRGRGGSNYRLPVSHQQVRQILGDRAGSTSGE